MTHADALRVADNFLLTFLPNRQVGEQFNSVMKFLLSNREWFFLSKDLVGALMLALAMNKQLEPFFDLRFC
jgi:hypothetical protein